MLHFECLGQEKGQIHALTKRTSLVIPTPSDQADSLLTYLADVVAGVAKCVPSANNAVIAKQFTHLNSIIRNILRRAKSECDVKILDMLVNDAGVPLASRKKIKFNGAVCLVRNLMKYI